MCAFKTNLKLTKRLFQTWAIYKTVTVTSYSSKLLKKEFETKFFYLITEKDIYL